MPLAADLQIAFKHKHRLGWALAFAFFALVEAVAKWAKDASLQRLTATKPKE